MNDADLLTMTVLLASVAILVAVGRFVGPRPGDAESLFRSPTDLGWPHGVQEEEPVRWKIELLRRGEQLATPSPRERNRSAPMAVQGKAPTTT